jgi:two-component system response regulator NreC
MEPETIMIVIADDHHICRQGIKMMLSSEQNLRFVGEASNGNELLMLVAKVKPDIVITDIQMPGMDGIEAAKSISKLSPNTGIIALSIFDDNDIVLDMLHAGALGYLSKDADKMEMILAINSVHRKEIYYNDLVYSSIYQTIDKKGSNKTLVHFTEREFDIIQAVCDGLTNKQIASKLYLSKRTIDDYRSKIMKKAGVSNGTSLVNYAIERGIYKRSK